MTSQSSPPKWRAIAILLGLFCGLCSIFALVVSIAEGWQEYRQTQWPAAEGRVQTCAMTPYQSSTGKRRRGYFIDCRIEFLAGFREITTRLQSRVAPAPQPPDLNWPDPMIRLNQMRAWVDAHPEGSIIPVHFNPANPKNAVLTVTDMPLAGPHTPDNLKLLSGFAAACLALLVIGRFRPPGLRKKSALPFEPERS